MKTEPNPMRYSEADCLSRIVLFPCFARARFAPGNRLAELERSAKMKKYIIITVAIVLLGVGGYFLSFPVLFIHGMHVQMKAGKTVLDGLNPEKIKTWEARSLVLWQKHKGHYDMGIYGVGRLPIPPELAELKIIRIDVYDDRIDYVWCGGMDHCTLIVEKDEDGYMHFTAEYNDGNRKGIFKIKLNKNLTADEIHKN